jgi:NAD(P)-dependent dehydrogenase (short-subunit alcohol dehydrogenase family)
MSGTLDGKRVLVVGRGSGIARGIADAVLREGATVIAAGRNPEALAEAYAGIDRVSVEQVDLTDDASIEALAARVGNVDHVVSTASARARGKIEDLSREAVALSFDTKVIGPLMLAKAMRGLVNEGGSLLLFSGEAAFKIEVGTLAVAITNGAADTLTRSLAVELAPIRVNALCPGVIDTGAWDGLGEEGKQAKFAHLAETIPVPRVGVAEDVGEASLGLLTNSYITGMTLFVDGGERLV